MRVLQPAELDALLSEVVARLRRALDPVAIYLFGSYAYGTPRSDSDLDLLVVVEDSPLHAYDRDAQAYLALMGLGVAKDVQVYTRAEFEQRAALPVSLEKTVAQRGRLLYAA